MEGPMTGLTNKTIFALATILLAISACAPPSGDQMAAENRDSTTPLGTVWRWSVLTGTEPLQVAQPSRYTLQLREDGSYAVRADCNTGGGSYALDGDRLSLMPGPMTMAACGPDSLGSRFATLLGDVAAVDMDGDRLILELRATDEAMEFVALKQLELAGTSWLVHGYNNGQGGVASVGAGTVLYATFTEDGTLAGSSGCNTYSGGYLVDGQAVEFGPLASTRKMCPGEGVMEQETAFLAALATSGTWEIRGERLQLRRQDGALAVDLVSAITGTVTYLTRQALRPGSEIKVSLQDISRADVAATVIAEQVIPAAGAQVPIPFRIVFDPAEIDPRFTYAVRATITRDGKLLFTSTETHAVITRDAPRYGVEIRVDRVGS
jgi:heat shock protein HslJ